MMINRKWTNQYCDRRSCNDREFRPIEYFLNVSERSKWVWVGGQIKNLQIQCMDAIEYEQYKKQDIEQNKYYMFLGGKCLRLGVKVGNLLRNSKRKKETTKEEWRLTSVVLGAWFVFELYVQYTSDRLSLVHAVLGERVHMQNKNIKLPIKKNTFGTKKNFISSIAAMFFFATQCWDSSTSERFVCVEWMQLNERTETKPTKGTLSFGNDAQNALHWK